METDRLHVALARALPPLALGLALFYAFLAAYWWLSLRPALLPLAVAWHCLVALFLGLALLAHRLRARPGAVTALSLAVALPTVAVGSLMLATTGVPDLAMGLYVAVLGFSLLLVSRAALLAVAALALAGWAWAAMAWGGPAWVPRGIALLGVCLAAFAAQGLRLGLYRRLEAAHRRELEAVRLAGTERHRRQVEEAKANFLRLAAHQLANPLTSIAVQSRLLGKEAVEGKAGERIRMLDRNVRRMERVLGDVLVVARSQAGALHARRRPIDAGRLAADEADVWRGAAAAAGVTLSVEAIGRADVQADEDLVRLALGKLLDNAIRFAPRGTAVRLSVRAEPQAVLLEVRDEGPGVDPARAPRLFEPFDAQAESADAGAGLGLAVADAAATAHGGAVEHRPGEGRGAVFTLRLPA